MHAAAYLAAGIIASILCSPPDFARAAAPAEYDKPVSTQLNTTGRAIDMPVPMKESGQTLGEVNVRLNPDDSVLVAKALLAEKLERLLDKATLEKLKGVPDTGGQVSLADLKAQGLNLRFDQGLMELVFEPSVDQRGTGEISLSGSGAQRTVESAASVLPAMFSGYLNVVAGVDQRWGPTASGDPASLRLELESVFRVWDLVIENEFLHEGQVDIARCPTAAQCLYDHTAGWKRRSSRATYDLAGENIRLQFGDTTPLTTTGQTSEDELGVSVEHSPRKLSPGETIRSSGRSSFRLERAAEVDVMVNGAILQHLRLAPGNYNLADLPLQAGANTIDLVITDETGEKRTLTFTSFHDGALLAPGRTEWSFAGGLPSYLRDNERLYRRQDWTGTGFFRLGVTERLTAEAHIQADNHVQMAGINLFSTLPWGFLGLRGAASRSDTGFGFSSVINYDLNNIAGLFHELTGLRENLHLSAEYRSPEFRTPGEFLATATGIIQAQQYFSWKLSGAYTVPLTDTLSASLAAHYQFGSDKAFQISPIAVTKDRYGVDLTLTSRLTMELSASLIAGYSNDSYLRDLSSEVGDRGDFHVGIRFHWRPDDNVRIAGGYDSLTKSGNSSASWSEGRGKERWDANVETSKTGLDDRATASGSVGYSGNRFEARAMQVSNAEGVGRNTSGLRAGDQRSSARVGTAIAFADDKVAIGAPIRGDAFAIVYPHQSIAGKDVTIGDKEFSRGKTDVLGPVLVTDIPAHSPTNLTVDVDDLPVGYSLGQGSFDLKAPYRGGYALEVGSAYSVSAYGTLLWANAEPVALLTGTATSATNAKKQVPIFTNAAGKFGADGLAPGRWLIEMATEGEPTRYTIEIPDATSGLFKAGTLKPDKT